MVEKLEQEVGSIIIFPGSPSDCVLVPGCELGPSMGIVAPAAACKPPWTSGGRGYIKSSQQSVIKKGDN